MMFRILFTGLLTLMCLSSNALAHEHEHEGQLNYKAFDQAYDECSQKAEEIPDSFDSIFHSCMKEKGYESSEEGMPVEESSDEED